MNDEKSARQIVEHEARTIAAATSLLVRRRKKVAWICTRKSAVLISRSRQ
jgi:hypothetical protein